MIKALNKIATLKDLTVNHGVCRETGVETLILKQVSTLTDEAGNIIENGFALRLMMTETFACLMFKLPGEPEGKIIKGVERGLVKRIITICQ